MRIFASPSLIQAGHRGSKISRAILKYSTAVTDQTRVLMLSVLVCGVKGRNRKELEKEGDGREDDEDDGRLN